MKAPLPSLIAGILMLLLAGISASGQVYITSGDFPQVGMLVVKEVDSTTAVSPGLGGTNQVWDFSNLVPSFTDSTLYVMPDGLPGSQHFTGSNLVEKDANASANFEGGYNYIFYHSTPEGWEIMGQELKISFWGISFFYHFNYEPLPVMLPFPCTYNTYKHQDFVWSSYSAAWYNGVQVDTSLVKSFMSVDMLTDGSGTILTPAGIFEALRVHETINTIDSVFHYSAGSGWYFYERTTSQFENYRWYADGAGEVGAIQVDAKKGSGGFTFLKSRTIVSTHPEPNQPDVTLYPNPVEELLFVNSPSAIERADLFDVKGRFIRSTVQDNIPVNGLQPGLYFLNIHTAGAVLSKKFIKQ